MVWLMRRVLLAPAAAQYGPFNKHHLGKPLLTGTRLKLGPAFDLKRFWSFVKKSAQKRGRVRRTFQLRVLVKVSQQKK